MDDLETKTENELRDIMGSAVANQHVPGSIYHRARLELERRTAKSREEHSDITSVAKSVLLAISKSKHADGTGVRFIPIEVLEHQFGTRHMPKVKEALRQLIDRDFVEELEDYPTVFKLTPFGVGYLSEMNNNSNVSYNNITISNIAHNSHGVEQKINISNLPNELQEHIKNLHEAARNNDAEGMKTEFNYIADNATNVASAITTGSVRF